MRPRRDKERELSLGFYLHTKHIAQFSSSCSFESSAPPSRQEQLAPESGDMARKQKQRRSQAIARVLYSSPDSMPCTDIP